MTQTVTVRFWHTANTQGTQASIASHDTIGAGFEMLCEADERCDAERIFSAFDAADGLGVNADQFRETLLRQIRPQTGVGHVAANDAQEGFVRHAPSWSVSALR